MCLYSLHIPEYQLTRSIRVGDTLRLGEVRNHKCFVRDRDKVVACIRQGAGFEFTLKLAPLPLFINRNNTVPQPDGSTIPASCVNRLDGKTVKARFVRWVSHHTHYAADAINVDGIVLPLSWLAEGTTLTKRRRVRKDKGTKRPRNLVRLLKLDEIKADVPVTKTAKV